ncbi:MAG: LysM peptidoglycan-binding domain-containing protein [Roseiflexaceae bacterium]|nr:LysM peptidoglycan-binding domain-containing protein [Roseiflexaceae bacterium]
MVIAITMILLPVFSVVVLSRASIPSLSIAGVNVVLTDPTPIPLPDDLLEGLPTEDAPHNDDDENTTPTDRPTAASITTSTAPPTITPAPPTITPAPPTITPAPPTATPALPTATPAPPTATSAPPTVARTYIVQPGDTLRAIAERYNVGVQALLDANNLTAAQADALRQGQELVIP